MATAVGACRPLPLAATEKAPGAGLESASSAVSNVTSSSVPATFARTAAGRLKTLSVAMFALVAAAPSESTTLKEKLALPLKVATGSNARLPAFSTVCETLYGSTADVIGTPYSLSVPAAAAGRLAIRISLSGSSSVSSISKSAAAKARPASDAVVLVKSDPVGAAFVPRT